MTQKPTIAELWPASESDKPQIYGQGQYRVFQPGEDRAQIYAGMRQACQQSAMALLPAGVIYEICMKERDFAGQEWCEMVWCCTWEMQGQDESKIGEHETPIYVPEVGVYLVGRYKVEEGHP